MNKASNISGLHWSQGIHLSQRFFLAVGSVVVLFCLGFVFPDVEFLARLILVLLAVLVVADFALLFLSKTLVNARRSSPKLLSLGDENAIELHITSVAPMKLKMEVYDELPFQLQMRDFSQSITLNQGEECVLKYQIKPLSRGEYFFGRVNVLATTVIGLVSRRCTAADEMMVPVYPSIQQMKKYELLAFARISNFEGIKHIRKIGHSYEFEKIRNYVEGDDIRSINWKATSRKNNLMVNQYEDERSQQVYLIIDKSRSMHMPFDGLSLLDYSINASLVLANIALKKYDKAGLITFSHVIGTALPAERSEMQLKKMMEYLYHEKPQTTEANYDLLYRAVKNVVHGRSLIFLFLNFESVYAMERALPLLQRINRSHLLVVVFFENDELARYSFSKAEDVSDIYATTIAGKLLHDKKQIAMKLRKHGIQTIQCRPADLTISTVNKYLELKARGMI